MQTPRQLGLRFAGMTALMSLIYSSFTSKAHFDGAGRSRGRASTRYKRTSKEQLNKPFRYRRAAAARAGHVSDRCPFAGMPYMTIAQHDEYRRSRMPGTPEHMAVEYGIPATPIGHVLVWQ